MQFQTRRAEAENLARGLVGCAHDDIFPCFSIRKQELVFQMIFIALRWVVFAGRIFIQQFCLVIAGEKRRIGKARVVHFVLFSIDNNVEMLF